MRQLSPTHAAVYGRGTSTRKSLWKNTVYCCRNGCSALRSHAAGLSQLPCGNAFSSTAVDGCLLNTNVPRRLRSHTFVSLSARNSPPILNSCLPACQVRSLRYWYSFCHV